MSDEEAPFLVVKIGGSLVSDKQAGRHLDTLAVKKYATAVAHLVRHRPGRVVFVAGGGSFGHGAVRGLDTSSDFAAVDLTEATFAVKWAWVMAFREAGLDAVPLQVAAMTLFEGAGTCTDGRVLRRLLEEGALPVLSGDSVLDESGQLRVLGSDHVPSVVIDVVPGPWRVVTLTDVPGVLLDGPDGKEVLPHVDPHDPSLAFASVWGTAAWDTSGAMAGKLDALTAHARRGAECLIMRGDPDADLSHLLVDVDEWSPALLHTRISVV